MNNQSFISGSSIASKKSKEVKSEPSIMDYQQLQSNKLPELVEENKRLQKKIEHLEKQEIHKLKKELKSSTLNLKQFVGKY